MMHGEIIPGYFWQIDSANLNLGYSVDGDRNKSEC